MPDARPTICELFFRATDERADETAAHVWREGQFEAIPWRQIRRDALRLAAALLRLGLQPGERVAQLASNRYEWIVADLAILVARGVHVPIHVTLAGEQIARQVAHCGARFLLLDSAAAADQLAPFADRLSGVAVVAYDHGPQMARHPLRPKLLEEIVADISDDATEAVADTARRDARPDDLATIVYTSGTAGRPKGVMLSQHNLAGNAVAVADTYDARPDELRLCFLPLSHIYARTCELYAWLYRGSQLALAQSRETLLDDCRRLRPTLINGVPYFYEKLYRGLRESGKADRPDVLRQLLGGRVRACFSGGAGVPEHVRGFFEQQGLPVLEGYGLSEASPVISATPLGAYRSGSVGRPIAGAEVRIADDGEILTHGPHVMLGYWRDEAATRAALQDGWLRTGDLGRLDDDGYLHITGRKKEIIVTAAGKKVDPAYLEQRLRQSPFILQAMVVGEGRNYLAALIVPDPEALRAEIRRRRLLVLSRRGALRHRRVRELYRQEIDRLLADVSRHEQIGRFALLDCGFTPESGELTPKASLRRDAIAANHARRIERMYR